MVPLFWLLFSATLVALSVVSGIQVRARMREHVGRTPPVVDDEAVRTILETGHLVTDEEEPLDLREIEEEERRFWSERWEEPEEW